MTKGHTVITFLDTPAFGGAEQYTLDCLSILNQQGNAVILYTNNLTVKKEFLKYINSHKLVKFEIRYLPFLLDAIGNWKGLVKFFLYAPFALRWVFKELTRIKSHSKQNSSEVLCLLVGFSDRLLYSPIISLLKLRLVWIEFGPLEPVFKRNWGFPKLLYFLTKHLPERFITISENTKKSMVNAAKINPKNIDLVSPAVTEMTDTKFQRYKKAGAKWRKLHIDADILISFVGRMASEKEVDLLLRAFEISYKKIKKSIHLVLIGTGPELLNYKILANQLGISDLVTFTGFVDIDEKYSILSACDVFVYPAAWAWEGFGITTIEALSVGTPVISPRFGPQMEIIENGKNGLQFEPHNAEDLAEKMSLLANNKEMQKSFSKNGLQSVRENFSYKTMEKNLLLAVEKVL